jgi:hypothetical protein
MTGTRPMGSTAEVAAAIVALIRSGAADRWGDAQLKEYVVGLLNLARDRGITH